LKNILSTPVLTLVKMAILPPYNNFGLRISVPKMVRAIILSKKLV